jgi:dTDP-4-amino-4,6-dideoxygalactose transaminase
MIKDSIEKLALFGGDPLFKKTKSTSNLVKPDFEHFLEYSKRFYSQHRYSNNGPLVKLLEQRLAEFHHVDYCVRFCSGFWALAITMKSVALAGKSEVIMPSLTYRRMDDIASWAGLKPVFYEVSEDGLTADIHQMKACVGPETALILGVHPIVNCCNVGDVLELSKLVDIPVIFDSVESVYEWLPEGKVGQFGEAEIFSMHASKLINGFEGGYVTTNDGNLSQALSFRRGFGFKGPDQVVVDHAMNAKLNEIHAAMALAGLDDLKRQVAANRERYDLYKRLIQAVDGLTLIEFNEAYETSYKNILVSIDPNWPLSRSLTIELLNAENILARPYYYPPLHLKNNNSTLNRKKYEITELLSERYMLLPCGHFISKEDIERIIELMEFMATNANAIDRLSIGRKSIS